MFIKKFYKDGTHSKRFRVILSEYVSLSLWSFVVTGYVYIFLLRVGESINLVTFSCIPNLR